MGPAQRVRNSSLRNGELADEVGEHAVLRISVGFGAHDRDGGVGRLGPVRVEVAGARVEELEAGDVHRLA